MSKLLTVCVVLACCCVSGTAWAEQDARASRKPKNSRVTDRGSYFERHGYTRLDIPKGHYPPPGECRVWYPDRPAGHQPPPVKCDGLRARVPRGAWVIRHPENDPEHVHVDVYDERRPGSLLVTGQFRIASGVFVRVVVDR